MHRSTSFHPAILAAAVAMALAPAAHAEEPATDLDRVIVTAARTLTTVDAALAAVEVIDRAQIEASTARSLPELLRGRAGITIVNQGGLGKLSTLFLRGTESDHTLFLIDGVRVGSPTSGLTMLQDLPLAQIERIEIVRGPRSSLYGSEAIGGVIQIFTRRGDGQGVRGRARIAAGSHGLREAAAGIDLRGTRGGVGMDVAHQDSDGINACRGTYDPATWAGAGCFIVPGTHLDRDGYRNDSAALRADFAPTEAWQFDARASRAEGRNQYDGDYQDNSDIVQQTVGGSVRWTPSDALRLKLGAGRNTDNSHNYIGSTLANRYTTTRDSASLQGDFGVGRGQLLSMGFDWLRDAANVTDPWSPFARTRGNRAVFSQYQGEFGAHDVQLSLRRDDNQQFGGHTTGGIAYGLDLAEGWRVTASHATAFKAPSFNELYYPGASNPDLSPETSRSSELSLIRNGNGWHVQANAYQTRVSDLIAWSSTQFMPVNVDEARIRGLELTGAATLGDWQLRGQLGWLDARNLDNDKRLARRPGRSARLDLDRSFGAWGFGLSGIAESARWDDVGNSLRVGGHATLDAYARWRFAPAWTLQANLGNVFDKRYETSAYYLQPGRTATLVLSWAPSS